MFAFVYFCFGFNLLPSRACFWVPLHCIFIGISFRFWIKLCLFTYFRLNYCVWTCFTLPYFRTLAFIWLSFCFLLSFRICVFSASCVMLFKIVWIRISLNLYANVWRTSRIFVWCNCILIAQKECLWGQPGFFLLHVQFFGLNY